MLKTIFLAAVMIGAVQVLADTPTTAPSAESAAGVLMGSPRHGEWADVALPGSDVKIHTWVVYPERKEKAPVVIVIHEIFGMSDWVRALTDQVAAEGFIAVAPDLLSGFGADGGGTESFKGDEMRAAFRKLTTDEQGKRLDAVREYALALPAAAGPSGTIGFCWGGGASFAYAVHQPKLGGAVVFYGTPPSKEGLAHVGCPVIGFYGGDDARVTSTVEPTSKTMTELGKSYDPHVFAGAGHGFMRQQTGRDGANLKAAQAAWPAAIAFLKQQLEKPMATTVP